LDEDTIGHIDNTAFLIAKALHSYVITYLRSQLASHLLTNPHSKACRSHSSRLANGNFSILVCFE
jgi:hypothetical protein